MRALRGSSTLIAEWRRAPRRLGALLAAWLLALGASAAPSRVAVVRPPSDDSWLSEALTRVQAELAAAGFAVTVLDSAPGQEPRTLVEAAALEPPPVATFVLVRGETGAAADIWVGDRLTRKTSVRRLDVTDVPRARAAEVLAVRAVELLRASLLEATVREPSGDAASTALPPDVAHWMAPAPAGDRSRGSASRPERASLRAGLGAAMIAFVHDSPPAFAPLLCLSYGRGSWSGRISIVAPAFGGHVSAQGGSASIRQDSALFELVGAWPRSGSVAGVLSAGAGAYHWHVVGEAAAPFSAQEGDGFGALFDAGAGLSVRLADSAGLFSDVHALALVPGVDVAIAEATVHTARSPIALFTLGFWVAL